MEKLPVYSRMCLTRKLRSSWKVGGGTGTTEGKLGSQLLCLILLLQHLGASHRNTALKHTVRFVL